MNKTRRGEIAAAVQRLTELAAEISDLARAASAEARVWSHMARGACVPR